MSKIAHFVFAEQNKGQPVHKPVSSTFYIPLTPESIKKRDEEIKNGAPF